MSSTRSNHQSHYSRLLTSDVSAKWADLQSRIQSEQETLAACRAGATNCPAAARRFLQIVELGRQHEGRARLAAINRSVNFSIKPVSDWAQYGVDDFWSAPLVTLSAGAGDCEDYAVVKYVALREAGIAPDDLRLLIVYYPRRRTNHVVVAVHLGEEWLILDNLTLIMVNSSDASGSNLTFESWKGFPSGSLHASLAHANRNFHYSQAC